ncbi:MAG TPA: DNA-binding protein [Acidobacteriota bacterium]|nr:DNA-binding protein [Acidobacteriota bacterium]
MKVKEIKAKAAVDEITLTIESIDEPREVRGGSLRVANATGVDETGSVVITLWNDDINKVKTGDKVKITKGWAGEYQGKIQLSAGKFGKLEVVGAGAAAPAKGKKKAEEVDFAVDEDII